MPYSVGLQSAANAFLSAGFATQFTLAVIAFLGIVLITSVLQREGPDSPKALPGCSLFHVIPFFRQRYDFLNWGFHATGQNTFQFQLLRVSGPRAPHQSPQILMLHWLFSLNTEHRYCGFGRVRPRNLLQCAWSGFDRRLQDSLWCSTCPHPMFLFLRHLILSSFSWVDSHGARCYVRPTDAQNSPHPQAPCQRTEKSPTVVAYVFNAVDHLFIVSARLLCINIVIPFLLEDTRQMMESWGASGKLDPFDKVYEVRVCSAPFVSALIVLFPFVGPLPADHPQSVMYGNCRRPRACCPFEETL